MMMKIANSLIVLGFAAALSLTGSSPTLAKSQGKASQHRAATASHLRAAPPAYQYNKGDKRQCVQPGGRRARGSCHKEVPASWRSGSR